MRNVGIPRLVVLYFQARPWRPHRVAVLDMARLRKCNVMMQLSTLSSSSCSYCSKECQRADWKSHKSWCKLNQLHAKTLTESFVPPESIPDGINFSEYDARLEDWVSIWVMTFCEAALHALRLPDDLNRCETHLLHVTLKGRPKEEHKGEPKLFFEVVSAVPRTIERCRELPGLYN